MNSETPRSNRNTFSPICCYVLRVYNLMLMHTCLSIWASAPSHLKAPRVSLTSIPVEDFCWRLCSFTDQNVQLSMVQHKSHAVVDISFWNQLPSNLRHERLSLPLFRKRLKAIPIDIVSLFDRERDGRLSRSGAI